MARLELTILLSVGHRFEGGAAMARLVRLDVLDHVVTDEPIQQVELEIVLLVELLALFCLRKGVVIVLVAFVCEADQKLLLSLQFQLGNDSLLEVHLQPLNGIVDLNEHLGLDVPAPGRRGLDRVQRLGLLLLEKFRLRGFCRRHD